MFVVLDSRFRSIRLTVAAALTVVVTLSLAGSIASRPPGLAPGQAAPPVVGELPDQRTATSETRRNADGTMTTTVYGMPAHYRAPDGSWQRIDSTLRPYRGDGYAWASGPNAFEMRFKPSAGEGFAELRLPRGTLHLHADGVRARSPGRVDGGQITYAGAYPGADLRYQVGPNGVRKVIDLSEPDSPSSYTFRLSRPDGRGPLTAEPRADGSFVVHAGTDLILDAPLVWEADGTAPVDAARPTLRVEPQGDTLVVTLGLDRDWLRAPGRRFPVRLDPSITVQPDVQHASYRTVAGSLPSSTWDMYVGSNATSTYRTGLQFDLGAVPAGAQVSSAQLGLFFSGTCVSGTCSGSHVLDVHRMTSAWSASSTFDQLTHDAAVAGSTTLASGTPAGWLTWPVTGVVSAWAGGGQPNYGLLLKRRTESLGSNGPLFLYNASNTSTQPKLDITYTATGVYLTAPSTLHADGAELAWTPASASGSTGYEVHRSASATFTPGPTTLLATIGDRSRTTYRDATASPGGVFTYRVKDLADGTVSVARTITLPGPGLSSKVLQPGPAAGRTTWLEDTPWGTCFNYGAAPYATLGARPDALSGQILERYRPAVHFDLRDIPVGATVNSATLSMWRPPGAPAGLTVQAHRITRPWKEGTSANGGCSGDGATWVEVEAGQTWTAPGGDHDPVAVAAATIPNTNAGFDQFAVTGLVQSWVAGDGPNHGVLLRAATESMTTGALRYATDDFAGSPNLRPRLTITYADGSQPDVPRVALSAPAPDGKVAGSSVRLAAAAEDDRRVDRVDFLVNSTVVGNDTTAPFEVTWNSTSVGNGSRTVTARATDDAGNVTTSTPMNVTVDNTAVPTGTLVDPPAGTVSGTTTVSATASDDVGVADVAFLVDGVRIGSPDSTSPYSLSWNTLDPLAPVYNGPHQVTAVITDTSGQQVTTAARAMTVNNRGPSTLSAGFVINDPSTVTDDVFPSVMAANTSPTAPVQDPYAGTTNPDGTSGGSLGRALASAPGNDGGTPPAGCPLGAYCPTIRVTNTSGATWSGSTAQVWYRWYAHNGAIMFEGQSTAAFPATFAANATQPFPLTIYPPALPPGAVQGAYRLRVDVYDPATATWFAAKGSQPLDNPVIVTKELATKLGFERFHQYEAEPVGAGMSTMTNIANGNLLWRWSPFFSPGRGLATMVDLTYNSLEDHSKSPAGNNVSLSVSGLIRFGEPLDIHPNKADEISGQSNKWVEFTDGDGSTHRFVGTTGTDGVTRWAEPPGVNLYLRSLAPTDPKGRWALTRPDKVTFYFDADGFPTMVDDRNGNRITFLLEDTPPGEDPGGPKKRITRVTDPSGGRSFVLDYWSKDENKKAHVRGKIQSITDHSGSRLDFHYYEDGNLRKLVQLGGLNANGTRLADRSFVFTYTTSNGAGPAIPAAADRVEPADKVANQSTRLFSIRDPRGQETTFAYYLAPDGQHLRWKLKSRTNRDGQTTGLAYDLTNRVTTVTAPMTRQTRYTYDVTGKVIRITNPLDQNVDVEWTTDYKVAKVTEPTGRFSRYEYNANGYPTLSVNQRGEQTVLTYVDSAVDANDTANRLSLLSTVTRPRGVLTPDPTDFRWSYAYDGAGNVDRVTDPSGAVTDFDFNLAGSANPGTVSAVRDANGNPPTLYEAYDVSGQPSRIKDPLNGITRVGYTADGQVRWVQDPNHAGDTGTVERDYKAFFDYDEFGRLGRQSAPKSTSTARGRLLWSSVEYDPNDNVLRTIAAHLGESTGDPENGAVTTTTFDPMDRPLLVTGPDTNADPAGERVLYDYDDAGRLAMVVAPRGVQSAGVANDFTTLYEYDALDRIRQLISHGQDTSAGQTRRSHACYDLAGDLRSVTAPRAALTSVTCPGTGPAIAPFTSTFTYDDAHRLTSQKDPLGHETRLGYDANGNTTSQETDIESGRAAQTQVEFNQRDLPEVMRERFNGATGREVVTRIEYDANGNRSRTRSPRAVEAAAAGQPNHYVTEFGYDALNRTTKVTLPFDVRDNAERQFVHNAYDANGNLLWTSLPVTTSDRNAVADTARTMMTYFDPGWIRTSDDPANPKVHFDYTALGQQASRTPEQVGAPGQLDPLLQMSWTYFPDGMVAARTDRGGQSSTYHYDAHNNLVTANDADGIADDAQEPVDLQASYTGFDQPAKTRFKRNSESVWTFSDYTYDAHGNVTVRRENGEENDGGAQSRAPRRYEMTYDAADWLSLQLDLGTTSACQDDQRVVNTFWATGWERQRDLHRAGAGCGSDPLTWPNKQTTTWTHFDNGLLRNLQTVSAGTVSESHEVDYVDPAGIYVNGNRTRDRYVLKRGEGSTATTCLTVATACDARYTYDARDRLIEHQQRAGVTTTYSLDQPGQLLGDTTIRAGNVTTETKNGVTSTRRYQADQLKDATAGGATARYWYTPLGDLDCITTSAGSQANCSPPEGGTATNLIADYAYDYLSRLTGTRQYSGGATLTDEATYVYDPLDRTVTEEEDHVGAGKDRTTEFSYQGMSGLVTEEKQTGGTDPKTKTYAYDAYGRRISMSDTNASGTTNTYTYGHDVHGSVSQLITDAGAVKASYGYDAYGGTDAPAGDAQALTAGDTDAQAPLNPFRYTGRRIDSGQATSAGSAAGYDMGARRYGPDFGRFLQQDMYAGALSNLGLALDPLTQNRYALAGGNPISFVEFDGHMAVADGGGGGAPSASPPPPPPPPSDQGGWEGLKRFGSQVGKNLWGSVTGTASLVKDSFRCEYTDNQGGCAELNAQLEHQFTTKEGWQETWNSLKEPFEQDCNPNNNRAPECAAHITTALLEVVGGKGLGRATRLGRACSFAGETLVLMADGSQKPISEVKVGDEVMATDPETGEKGARTVTHVWVHKDELVKLELDGHPVTTTEDHPFWNETDKQWQRADELDSGDAVRSATGELIRVNVLRTATTHSAPAYNLTVDDIHTYYVVAGTTPVLVHNTCGELHFSASIDDAMQRQITDLVDIYDANGGRLPDYIARGGGPQNVFRNNPTQTTGQPALPVKPYGYYHEADVVALQPNAAGTNATRYGTPRLVFGNGGEVYYTTDHYENFDRLR